MQTRNYFFNGITELLVLAILRHSDCYTYDICKTIEDSSCGLLSISQNTIYTAIYKLKAEEKIQEFPTAGSGKRRKVFYAITEKGLQELEALEQDYKNTLDGVQSIMDSLK